LGHRRLLVHAGTLGQLTGWAGGWPARRFAVEGAYGLGRPIAQQLAAAGEQVLDVPATLASRARLLGSGGGRKTDAADAASVAQVALHNPMLRVVTAEDQTTILRLLAERRDDLAGERTRILNRLHGLLRDLLPGGAPTNLRQVDVPVLPDSACGTNQWVICLDNKDGKSACYGDSGGPLLVGTPGSWRLGGDTSGGPGVCGTEDFYYAELQGSVNTWIDWSLFRHRFGSARFARSETHTNDRSVSQHNPSSVRYVILPFLVRGNSYVSPPPTIVQSPNRSAPIQRREDCCERTAMRRPRSETAE